MPDAELTGRLRDAFALPHEPGPGREVSESLTARLPRYRNRRRGALGGSFGGLAVVLALILVLALGGFSSGPAKPPTVALANLQCVELQIGGTPAHCVGHIDHVDLNTASSAATNRQSFGSVRAVPPQSVRTVKLARGTRVTVSLPKRSGLTWRSVTLNAQSATGPRAGSATPVAIRRGPQGRTVAVIDHAPVGGYTLVALATAPCAAGQSCATRGLVWTIQLLVD